MISQEVSLVGLGVDWELDLGEENDLPWETMVGQEMVR
jgi:hypothetical protein